MTDAQHEEYRAARERAVLIDRTERGRIAIGGNDRATFLQGLLTNDVTALAPGTGCYAAYLTPQGRLIADMRVLELGEVILLDVHPDVRRTLVQRFEDLVFTEDVQIDDWTEAWALIGVHGPDAAQMVAGLFQASAAENEPAPSVELLVDLPEYSTRRWAFGEAPVIVARSWDFGLSGLDLFVPRPHDEAIRAAAQTAGASALSHATAEVLRVEAGRPAFHIDMDEDTIPLEAGIEDRAISLTKGCYVGQEVIIRVLHRGHGRVAKRLVGLSVDGPVAPGTAEGVVASGDRVLSGDRDIGRVTSAVFSPARGRPIALGYVHRDFLTPGTEVAIEHDGRRSRAVVTELPFVPFSGAESRKL